MGNRIQNKTKSDRLLSYIPTAQKRAKLNLPPRTKTIENRSETPHNGYAQKTQRK